MKVWVLTGAVHCGKTTFLTAWCDRVRAAGRGAVHGVLGGPDDAAGRRHLTLLPAGTVRCVQCLAPEAAALQRARDAGTPGVRATVTVGAYTFFEDAMQWARDALAREADAIVDARAHGDTRELFFVLDELGPLEIVRGLGFEPFVSALFCSARFAAFRALDDVHVIVVVRAHMVDRFAAKYLPDAAAPPELFTPTCPLWLRYSPGIVPNFPYHPDEKQQQQKQQ